MIILLKYIDTVNLLVSITRISMQVTVSGKQMQIGESLKEYVVNRVTNSVERFSNTVTSAEVSFTKNPHKFYSAQIMMRDGVGHDFYKADANSDDVYASFDEALIKLDKQLRRHKDKAKDHHKSKASEVYFNNELELKGKYYVVENNAVKEINSDPITIAEKSTNIPSISVGEAILRLEKHDAPCILFRNARHGKFNIVYKRADGNIGWVDPEDY